MAKLCLCAIVLRCVVQCWAVHSMQCAPSSTVLAGCSRFLLSIWSGFRSYRTSERRPCNNEVKSEVIRAMSVTTHSTDSSDSSNSTDSEIHWDSPQTQSMFWALCWRFWLHLFVITSYAKLLPILANIANLSIIESIRATSDGCWWLVLNKRVLCLTVGLKNNANTVKQFNRGKHNVKTVLAVLVLPVRWPRVLY